MRDDPHDRPDTQSMTSELILHHYDFSNYSEKVRLVLGLKGLTWRSVEIPPTLPKPDYIPLTGGYRRTPALQIGADVFCDTTRIIEELEHRFPEPTIYPGPDTAAQRAFIAGLERWTDSTLTRNTINYISCEHAHADRFTPECTMAGDVVGEQTDVEMGLGEAHGQRFRMATRQARHCRSPGRRRL